MAVAQQIGDSEEAEDFEVQPSELDEMTHAELCLLYRESADSIRFAKAQQWKTLGATLLFFGALMIIADYNMKVEYFVQSLVMVSFVLSAGAIYSLTIFQFQQNSEREKIQAACQHFSNLCRDIRSLKSSKESSVFRCMLLAFMIIATLIGNGVLLFQLSQYLDL